MRRLTGRLDGVEYVILEYDRGQVEVPQPVRDVITTPEGALPLGAALEEACRVLFGDTLEIREL